jgi:ubiquinone/menaquinone biosynthesis C-methylase UbiE
MEIIVTNPSDIPRAYTKYYSSLADHFKQELESGKIRVILEAGCGKGQLTIPLLKKLPRAVQMIAVDSSRGPYSGWLDELPQSLRESGLEDRVRILEADVSDMPDLRHNSVDAIVSNELLCDLVPKARLIGVLDEFWRVLRAGGIMVHAEWSSYMEGGPRSLLVKHRPSWTPDQIHLMMFRRGFTNFHVSYFESTIRFMFEAAMGELRSWGASSKYLRQHEGLLKRDGFVLPFEHVIRCEK